ncbi:phage tail tape measure protein [Citrobacter freundii]|uniref:phage tail tape measure protein n=1 Tax=Citrobacter freundii TaxID=546 RepID=UPI00292ADD13|nr:phage tail tape measure protein [Citrobacter freundii]MDV0653537.1 phage tail tape measure protein [Citrobacter freundii]MDV0720618.1 phage tail tape measure protein [Citrobacter freundii]MEB0615399.1 phage tail tape measure protein [Citrobacter freundii]MEB0689237.1 phage tail tape measure protein [Citrobacter freundii]
MAIVNELITKFGFIGNLAPQETFNANLKASIGLLAGMGAAIQGSAGAMAAWFTSIIDGLDPLVQFHRETGLSVEGLQELGRVAELNGSSMEAVTSSIGEMTMRIGEFVSTGEGEMADIGKRLGLQFKDANGNVKDATQTFIELSDKMRSMSQAEKFSVLDKMGIDRSMVQMLSLSREELDKSLKQARDWGVVTTEQADAAAEFNNSLKDLRMGYSSVSTQLALSFLPMLKEVIDGMREWLHTNSDLIKNGLHHLGEIIFSVAGMIRRLLPLIGLATAGFVIWKIAAIGLRTVLSTIFSPVLLITAAIVGILLVIDDLVVAMQGGKSVIADFFMDTWGIDIVPALKAAKAALMAFIDYAINVFKPLADAIASMFKMVWHLITGAFTGDFQDAMNDAQNVFDSLIAFITGAFGVVGDAIKYVFGDAGEFVVDVFTTAIENTKLMFSALWKLVTGDFEGAWGDVVKIFDNGVELMKKPFTAFIDWAKNIFAGLGEYISNIISNAASNAWNATKSFFGVGEDEQQQGVTGGGNGGMSPGGIPYGMNAAVGLGSDSSSYNNSYSFSQQNYITAPDAVAAGNAVADSTQQQQKDAKRMFSRNGK